MAEPCSLSQLRCIITILQPSIAVNSVKLLNSCDFSAFSAQSDVITVAKQLTVPIVAAGIIVDAIAIANVETVAGAVAPDGVLREAWKGLGESGIELPRVDVAGEQSENVCAATSPVAAFAIGMLSAQPPQDGRFDARNYAPGCRPPPNSRRPRSSVAVACPRPAASPPAPSRQDLVRNPIDIAQRADDGLAQGRQPIRRLAAAIRKPPEMRLKAFMKQAGGVNECAAGYADKRRRHRRPHC
jgi:hypothetical protein